jgi:cytochrome c peroxidase
MNIIKKQFFLLAIPMLSLINSASAEGFGPLPISLKAIPIPEVPGLVDGPDPIVIDKNKAIILGKALFWDTNIGSDGVACASCHFHAGADSRVKNQLSPTGKTAATTNFLFDPNSNGEPTGPNYTLKPGDFPFTQHTDPLLSNAQITFQTDDVVSSSGTFSGDFVNVARYQDSNDDCIRSTDPVFHVGAIGIRRVEPRNTPTVINSAFNHRNFWDGRANNIFNGSSMWGDRDLNAGIWVKTSSRSVQKQRLALINSSLASQAMSPPLSDTEMGCRQRSFPAIARKILSRRPLENQKVHWNDSILGSISRSTPEQLIPGLNTTYRTLIRQAFNKKYWSYSRKGQFGSLPNQVPYNQMEANFSLFFGLAIQLYESTLISDSSPFDNSVRDENGLPVDLTENELNGLKVFREAHCAMCHIGPTFSTASITTNAEVVKTHPEAFGNNLIHLNTSENVVTRTIFQGGTALNDIGYSASGVTTNEADIGLGGFDDFGNPLSFSAQYVQHLANNQIVDSVVATIKPCNFDAPLALDSDSILANIFTNADGIAPQSLPIDSCITPSFAFQPTPQAMASELANTASTKALVLTDSAFKVPSLRNIELTGPFMHNGGMSTLEQVVEFYTRGGNFDTEAKSIGLLFPQLDLRFDSQKRDDLVAFLKTLTDERVRFEKAPFDHPELLITHGHTGDHINVFNENPINSTFATDEFIHIDAVGAGGRMEGLLPFNSLMAP